MQARAQRGRLTEFVERRGWGAVAAPALGAIVLASLFGAHALLLFHVSNMAEKTLAHAYFRACMDGPEGTAVVTSTVRECIRAFMVVVRMPTNGFVEDVVCY